MNDTIKSIATIMKDLDGILLFPHTNMDGDALGSCTALCLALRDLGKKAYVMINEPVPKNLDFLECGCTTTDDSVLDDVQLSLMIDCNGMNRQGEGLGERPPQRLLRSPFNKGQRYQIRFCQDRTQVSCCRRDSL